LTDNNYIIIGRLGKTYGVRGWLRVNSYTEDASGILDYTPWHLQEGKSYKLRAIADSKKLGNGLIVKFDGVDTPENAKLLTGSKVAILSSQLPALEEGEYYWKDLEGLTVIDQDGNNLGKILYIMETGSNDVLVVKGEKEHAIPYLPNDVVKNIDLKNKIMYVNWEII